MTIYEIKEATKETSPYFFSRDTLKFFRQTMKSFRVSKQEDGRYKIIATIKDCNGYKRETVRFYNPLNHELERR